MSYFTLQPGKGFLADLKADTPKFGATELAKAERAAITRVNAVLKKRFSEDPTDATSGTPEAIQEVAEMLGAAWILTRMGLGDEAQTTAALALEKRAIARLDRIISGAEGIELRNGAWHPDFPGTGNKERSSASGAGMSIL